MLREKANEHPALSATFFEPDARKAGGVYRTIEGRLKDIDYYDQCLALMDGNTIPLQMISDINNEESIPND